MKKSIKTIIAFAAVAAAFTSTWAAPKNKKTKLQTVTLGVTGTVYEDLWAPAIKTLKAQGINLKLVQFSDYVTPNNALANKEIDLNGFQHRIFFEGELKKGYKLTNIGNTFLSPMNLYSNKIKSVDQLKKGDIVAIPNDVSNGGRALKVLADAEIITLKADAGFNPSVDDIVSNNKGVVIKELAANTIPSVLPDVAAAVVNGNYAIDFGIDPETAIFKDSTINESEYWNLIAARTEDLSDSAKVEVFKKIVKAYQSAGTLEVYNKTYNGYYLATGWDEDRFELISK